MSCFTVTDFSSNGKKVIVEVKSFVDISDTRKGTDQAAGYARSLDLSSVTLPCLRHWMLKWFWPNCSEKIVMLYITSQ